MAPEQARGEEVDARADLFSFGAVLYQTATGKLPFDGPTSAVIFHAILEKNPPPATDINPMLPPAVNEVIQKCLEKDPDLRCQSAAELRADLKRIKRGSSTSSGRMDLAATKSSGARITAAPSQPSNTDVLAEAKRHKWRLILTPVVTALVILGYVAYKQFSSPKTVINPLNMQISKLTENGAATSGAISRDGRYAAFIKRGEQESLWVKQIATGSEAQVVAPGPGRFINRPTFSPDGNYIYFEHSDPQDEDENILLSVASLGGAPQRVLSDITTPVSFSPDGKQIVFVHYDPGEKKSQLVVANSDGANRHTIVEREQLAISGAAPSWSGDGALIAVAQYELGKVGLSSILIFKPDGAEVKSFPCPFLVDGISWLPDSSGMFLQVRGPESNFRRQIKFQPYPSGDVQNVTNDLNQYFDITVTADGRGLATIQQQPSEAVYLGSLPAKWPGEIKLSATPITTGQAEGGWLQWSPDGRIFFDDSDFHSFRMNADGSSRARVPDRETNATFGSSCGPDAVVFGEIKDNMLNLYRQNTATGEIKQLTSERDSEAPVCTRDGKTVYYVDNLDGPALKRISTAGGTPEVVAQGAANGGSLSPDDKKIVFFQFSGGSSVHKVSIVIKNVDGSGQVELPSTGVVNRPGWAPDGKALVVAKRTGAGANLFYQPMDGSAPTQLTHFDTEPLWAAAYAFSPDGKQIAVTRARVNDADLVMFKNFR